MTRGDMTGEAAIVTGAASGLGRATALRLASVGADLALYDINQAGLDETVAMFAQSNVKVIARAVDISDADACRTIVPEAIAVFGRLDALCNVAGIVRFAHTTDMAFDAYAKVIAINLTAPFLLCQAALPHLIAANGAIVNVVSTAAFLGEAYLAAYCASKAGLLQMTKALAMEYAQSPIRINAIAPGGMLTNIVDPATMPRDLDRELIKRYSGLRGTVEVEDVAEMIAHLASDAGRGFHGTCVTIDAGIAAG